MPLWNATGKSEGACKDDGSEGCGRGMYEGFERACRDNVGGGAPVKRCATAGGDFKMVWGGLPKGQIVPDPFHKGGQSQTLVSCVEGYPKLGTQPKPKVLKTRKLEGVDDVARSLMMARALPISTKATP
jgi:hypothetical protein